MCGFIGVVGSDDAVREIHDGLLAVQHRGQDAAGIITYDGLFHIKKGEGLVRDIFTPANFTRLTGSLGVGHVRYPTVGSGGGEDAQPFTVNYPFGIVMAHNGNVANYAELREELVTQGQRHLYSACDVEVLLNVFANALAREAVNGFSLEAYHAAVRHVYEKVRGAYSVVGYIAGYGMFAFRDPYGIKPISVGRRRVNGKDCHAVASESVVLTTIGYEILPTGSPGTAVFINLDGTFTEERIMESKHHPCVFEYVYFARPDSYLEGVSVYQSRLRMGEKMAATIAKLNLDAEVVIPVPDSARTAALALAQALGLPYREGLVKNRYVGRTFIMPNDGERRDQVRRKMNTIDEEFRGKNVLIVDDSIVRGTTSRRCEEGLLCLDLTAAGTSVRLRDRHEHPARVRGPGPHERRDRQGNQCRCGGLPGSRGSGELGTRGQSRDGAHVHGVLLRRLPHRRHHVRDVTEHRTRATRRR